MRQHTDVTCRCYSAFDPVQALVKTQDRCHQSNRWRSSLLVVRRYCRSQKTSLSSCKHQTTGKRAAILLGLHQGCKCGSFVGSVWAEAYLSNSAHGFQNMALMASVAQLTAEVVEKSLVDKDYSNMTVAAI